MSRRSTPQKLLDERAFPVRLLVWEPQVDRMRVVREMHEWLQRNISLPDYAWHPAGRAPGQERTAFYFRDPETAADFRAAFPAMELADEVAGPIYTSPHSRDEDEPVCNLYNMTRAVDAMRQMFRARTWIENAGNLEPGSVYPDRLGAIIRHDGNGGLELTRARWGLPSPTFALEGKNYDKGVTNIRNTGSGHWRRWMGPGNRCIVPVTSFAEPKPGGNQWFAPPEGTDMWFAGIEIRGHTSVRKVKDGPTTDNLYAFLTTEPNAEVGAVHQKAMPVILRTRAECETWLDHPSELALRLQRSLPDGSLRLVDGPI